MANEFGSAKDIRQKLLWAVLFVFIAAASVWAVFTASRGLSPETFRHFLSGAEPIYLIFAVLSMMGFIFFEGMAVRALVKAFGYPCGVRESLIYGASDIYFSAITPSATGGQPACIYFMVKNGIPLTASTVCLLMNLAMYTLSIIVLAVASLVLNPSIYLFFRPLGRVLIIIGFGIQILLFLFFLLMLKKDQWILSMGQGLIRLLSKLHILRHPEHLMERLSAHMADYKSYAVLIRSHAKALRVCFLYNLIQRACQLLVTAFTFLSTIATPGEAALSPAQCVSRALSLFGAQSLISIGATFIPIPGAMGVTDMMMLDGFNAVTTQEKAAALVLLSRSISFYGCVILSLVIVIVTYVRIQRKNQARRQIS